MTKDLPPSGMFDWGDRKDMSPKISGLGIEHDKDIEAGIPPGDGPPPVPSPKGDD